MKKRGKKRYIKKERKKIMKKHKEKHKDYVAELFRSVSCSLFYHECIKNIFFNVNEFPEKLCFYFSYVPVSQKHIKEEDLKFLL